MAKSKKDNLNSFDGMFNGVEQEKENTLSNDSDSKKGRPVEDREKKARKSIAIFPSIYDDASKIAYVDRTSVSELISNLLEEYINKNKNKITEYEKIKND